MAVNSHLGFYRTANSAIRSAGPENPGLELNMEWIGYVRNFGYVLVSEICAFELYCDLESGVWDHSRSSKVALFDTAHMSLYSFSIVNMPLSITVSEIYLHLVENCYPLVYGVPVGGEAVRFTEQLLVEKN